MMILMLLLTLTFQNWISSRLGYDNFDAFAHCRREVFGFVMMRWIPIRPDSGIESPWMVKYQFLRRVWGIITSFWTFFTEKKWNKRIAREWRSSDYILMCPPLLLNYVITNDTMYMRVWIFRKWRLYPWKNCTYNNSFSWSEQLWLYWADYHGKNRLIVTKTTLYKGTKREWIYQSWM